MIYVVAQQHPTLPEVSMFTTKSKADADQYQAIGWTVLEIEEPVQPAAKPGRTNSGDETGGTVKRFGFDISNGKSDIIPATNGAYVYYDDYLALHRKLEPQSALIDAELPELPRPDRNAWPHGFHDLYTAQQMRDYTQQAAAPILAKLATQVALVEKCMVAMNENADKGEKAEAEVGRLVRKLALDREEFKSEHDRLKAQRVQPDPLSDRHAAELKALSMLLRNMEGPVTLSAKKIAIAEAIEAAVRMGGAR